MNEPTEESHPAKSEHETPELPNFLAHPDRIDKILLTAIGVLLIFTLAMIPLRAYLVTHPLLYSLFVGAYTSSVIAGANVSVGEGSAWVYLLASLVGGSKFVPVYWAAGRKWGQEFIDMTVQNMPRMKRLTERTLAASKVKSGAIIFALLPLSYLPLFIPATVLNTLLGILKFRFIWVMVANLCCLIVINGGMMWLGYTYGESVLAVISVITRYMVPITIGLIVVMVYRAYRQAQKSNATTVA